jgi:hypothetical protein
MTKLLLSICLILNVLYSTIQAQACEITSVNATALPCQGNNFMVSVDLDVVNPSSPGFTLAGNGVIYGTYLYSDLPVIVGPLFGDDESVYEFIAWDVENADCQEYTNINASNCGPVCSISNFTLEFFGCQGTQSALVVFDFDYENPTGLTFDLFNEEGEEIGTYLYQSLPVTEPFFLVNGAAPIILTVCDHVETDCCETFVLDAIDCTPNNCELFSVTLDPDCNGSNFVVNLDFGYDNPTSDSFMVTGNNLNYGTFAYDSLPITLGPLNGSSNISWEFNIVDSENSACAVTEVLGIYNCPPPCEMLYLEALALECFGNEAYALEIGLDIEGEGDTGFAIFSETSFYGSYSYEDLPIILPEFESTCEFVDYVSVCDNENLGCCATVPFEALQCCGCLIYNLTAIPLPCNAQDEIFVQIDFDHQNTSSEGFEVSGNGNNYGQFDYEDLPIQVGPFVGDGTQYFEFVVTDVTNGLCFEAVELGFVDCDTICELTNLTVETGDCTGNNTFVLHVDFDYQGVTGVGFDLFVNGVFFDAYSYSELPLTIEEFPSNGTGTNMITVCENDNNICCASTSFASPICACSIFDLSVEILGCVSDSTYTASLEFFHDNMPGNTVDVFLDGVLMGVFNVSEIPLTVALPEGDESAVLSVCASDLNNCCDQVTIEPIMCENPECNITDLVAESGECNSDSTFLLDIVFNHGNLPTDSIIVTANGEFVGQYLIQPEFNRIENFPALGATTLTVCAVGEPDCCDTYSFTTPDCSLFGQCQITGLVADSGECTSDSTYFLVLEFNSLNLDIDSVIITGNGNFIGQFEVTNQNITIPQFPVYESPLTTLTVCAVGEPDCCDSFEFETPDCSQFGLCNISDLIAEVGDCTSDTSYFLHVDFNSINLSIDSVTVTGNGNYIGQYQVHPDGFAIENFPVYGPGNTTITVCSVGEPDCCESFEFETPDCEGGGPCSLVDLIADAGDCTSDSTYVLFINYETLNLNSDSVSITANGEFVGHFLHNEEGFTIENFPVVDGNGVVITVCSVGAPDCCDTFEFEAPDCVGTQTCNIFDLTADTGAGTCNGDSTYALFIFYIVDNFTSDSVVVSTAEGYSGHFAHDLNGINIPNFPAYNTNYTTITVCALGDEDCCDSVEFETVDCGQEFVCEIYDLFAEAGDCTSDTTHVVDVVFEGFNLPTDSVFIFANSNYVGTYAVDPEFIHIENFPDYPGTQTIITVCAVEAPDCCASYTFETPTCSSECGIFEIDVDVLDCNSDSTFALVVDFQHENLPGNGFDVYAGDEYVGFFSLNELPVEIPQFPSNETGQYVITICESDGTECCSSFEFQGPICGSPACNIFNLEYALTNCDSAGNFFFILDFDFDNVGGDGFNVIGNGNEYGNFSYENVPVQIGPFPSDDTVYEFNVSDAANPSCFDIITPGIVDCIVSTTTVDYDAFFSVFNNGTIPGIYAKKDIILSVYNVNGKNVLYHFPLSADEIYELNTQPSGLYMATLMNGSNIWSVKLVKAGN